MRDSAQRLWKSEQVTRRENFEREQNRFRHEWEEQQETIRQRERAEDFQQQEAWQKAEAGRMLQWRLEDTMPCAKVIVSEISHQPIALIFSPEVRTPAPDPIELLAISVSNSGKTTLVLKSPTIRDSNSHHHSVEPYSYFGELPAEQPSTYPVRLEPNEAAYAYLRVTQVKKKLREAGIHGCTQVQICFEDVQQNTYHSEPIELITVRHKE